MSTQALIGSILGSFTDEFEAREQFKEDKARKERLMEIEGLRIMSENAGGQFTREVSQQATVSLLKKLLGAKGEKGEQAERGANVISGIIQEMQSKRPAQPSQPSPFRAEQGQAPSAPEPTTLPGIPPSPLGQFETLVPVGADAAMGFLPPLPEPPPPTGAEAPTGLDALFKTPMERQHEARSEREATARLEVWAEQFKTQLQQPFIQRNVQADVESAQASLGRELNAVELEQIVGKHLDVSGFGGPTGVQTLEDETPGAAIVSSDPSARDAFGQPVNAGTVYKSVVLPAGQGVAHFPKAESPSAAQEKLNLEIEAFKNEHPNVSDAGARRGVLTERRKATKLQLASRTAQLRSTKLRNQVREELKTGLSETTARQILFHTRREAEAIVDGNFENIGISADERARQVDEAQKKLLKQGYGIHRNRILGRLGLLEFKVGDVKTLADGRKVKIIGYSTDEHNPYIVVEVSPRKK